MGGEPGGEDGSGLREQGEHTGMKGLLAACLLLALLSSSSSSLAAAAASRDEPSASILPSTGPYPRSIMIYQHRRDRETGEPVSRGRLRKLGGLGPLGDGDRVSLEELRRVLQCAPDEPDLVGDRGSVLLATRLAPPTREIVRLMAVWAETQCEDWAHCHEELKRLESGSSDIKWGAEHVKERRGFMTSPFQVRLLRVIGGKLFMDWPFHQKARFGADKDYLGESRKYALLHLVLGKLKPGEMNDSAFFFGEEISYLPFNFPFFAFSASPTHRHADMPWPWNAHMRIEVELYQKYMSPEGLGVRGKAAFAAAAAAAAGGGGGGGKFDLEAAAARMNQHDDVFNSMNTSVWDQKKPKAAFYGAMSSLRHTFFDVAAQNPELIDAGWTGGINSKPWNPLSREREIPFDDLKAAVERDKKERAAAAGRGNGTNDSGFLSALLPSHMFEGHSVNYLHLGSDEGGGGGGGLGLAGGIFARPADPRNKFKYLVVLIGGNGLASADRLAAMMLHSGAVLLIQHHDFEYHFSSRLKPWVHFVPLSFSTADLPDKIRWLQQNDHLARILAHNARTFALSHLRLEDMVCYAANALALVGSVPPSEPFDPIPLEGWGSGPLEKLWV